MRNMNGLAKWASAAMLLAAPVWCRGEITLAPVVVTGVPAPGNGSPFHQFGPPSLRNGNIGLAGSSSVYGLYATTGGFLHRVVDTQTPVPGGTSNFWGIVDESFDGINTAFAGAGVDQRSGIYGDAGGALHAIADTTTPIPGWTGTFTGLAGPAIRYGQLAFRGYGANDLSGVYSTVGGLHKVADTATPRPEGGNFTSFDHLSFDFDGQNTFFIGRYSGGRGIYTDAGGTLHAIARSGDPTPRGGTYQSFAHLSADEGALGFVYTGSNGRMGLAIASGGTTQVLADLNTLVPGTSARFDLFSRASMDNGNMAFVGHWGRSDPEFGIFASYNGTLLKVIDTTDTLAGKDIVFLNMDNESFQGNQVAFMAEFDDGTQAIYVATIPEPAGILLIGLGAAGLLRRGQRRS